MGQTDGRTEGHQTVALRFPLDAASIIIIHCECIVFLSANSWSNGINQLLSSTLTGFRALLSLHSATGKYQKQICLNGHIESIPRCV